MSFFVPDVLNQKLKQFTGSKLFWWLMLGLVCVQVVPFLLLGADSYFNRLDTYEQISLTKAIISHGDSFHPGTAMEYIMNGLPRGSLNSPFNLTFLLYLVFNSPAAYIINYGLSHIIGFLGMYLLLKNHFIKDKDQQWLAPVIALLFASVPWYSIYGLLIAGQPFLYYSFLNLANNKQKWTDWLIIILFPFTTVMILIAPFIVCALGIGLVVFWYRKKQFPKNYCAGLLALILAFVLSDIAMIYEFFFVNPFVSHRTDWPLPDAVGIFSGFRVAIENMFFTHFHGGVFLTRVIIFSFLLYVSIAYSEQKFSKRLLTIPLIIFLVCLFQSFYPSVVHYLGGTFGFLKTIQFDRFYFLLHCLWLVWFALLIAELFRIVSFRLIAVLLISFQFVSILQQNEELTENLKKLSGTSTEIGFNQYFAVAQFDTIKKTIGEDPANFRVASLGIPPNIAMYNGFYVLDGYFNSYPLSYKQRIRKVMEKELDKRPDTKKYFDEWGNRCYLFPSDLDGNYACRKEMVRKINTLEFDTRELRTLGCKYVISAAEIIDPEKAGFTFEKEFMDPNSAWDIYLYRLL